MHYAASGHGQRNLVAFSLNTVKCLSLNCLGSIKGVVRLHLLCKDLSLNALNRGLGKETFNVVSICSRKVGKSNVNLAGCIHGYGLCKVGNLVLVIDTDKGGVDGAFKELAFLMVFVHVKYVIGRCLNHLGSFGKDNGL